MPNGKDQGGSAVAENKPAKKAKTRTGQVEVRNKPENSACPRVIWLSEKSDIFIHKTNFQLSLFLRYVA